MTKESRCEDWPKQEKTIVYAIDGCGDKILLDEDMNPVLDEDGNFIKLNLPKIH